MYSECVERIAIFLARARAVLRAGLIVAAFAALTLVVLRAANEGASAELSARALEFLGGDTAVVAAPPSAPLIPRLAGWLELDEAARARLVSNTSDDFLERSGPLSKVQVAVLAEVIDRNGLGEASSLRDYDDGNGRLEAWELGHQLWLDGQLIALSLEAGPHESFGYRLGELPENIGALEALQVLALRQGALRTLPEEIGTLAQLRALDLVANDLAGVPATLTELSQLRFLALSSNPLVALPQELRRLRSLEEVHLRDTALEELPSELMQIPSLLALDLSRSAPARHPEANEPLPDSLWAQGWLAAISLAVNELGCDVLSGIESIDRRALGSAMQVHGLHAERCR